MKASEGGKINAISVMPKLVDLANEAMTTKGLDKQVKEIVLDFMASRGQGFLDRGDMQLRGVLRWYDSTVNTYYTNGLEYVTEAVHNRDEELEAAHRASYMNVAVYLRQCVDFSSDEYSAMMDAFTDFTNIYGDEEFVLSIALIVEEDDSSHLADPELITE